MDDVCGIDTGFSPFPVWSGVPGTAARCEAYQIFTRWQDGRCFPTFPVDNPVDKFVHNGVENAPRGACVRGLPVFPALDCLPVRVCRACSSTGEKRLRQSGAGCRFVPPVCPASGFASVHAMPSLCALPENGMIMPCFSMILFFPHRFSGIVLPALCSWEFRRGTGRLVPPLHMHGKNICFSRRKRMTRGHERIKMDAG